MNKMKKITALLLCVIMVVYAPMTAFANSDMIGTDTTILETTTPTDPVVGCRMRWNGRTFGNLFSVCRGCSC